MRIQAATKQQAEQLAYLINRAGEGIPEYLWRQAAEPGQAPLAVGAERAARDKGGFSYKNMRVAIDRGELLGMVLAYGQPDPYVLDDLNEMSEVVRPLVQLEAQAPGTWYINAIATFERFCGRGVARQLLREAEEGAAQAGYRAISLIVASENLRARQLYAYLGYQKTASLPVVTYPGCQHGGDWELMIKSL